MFVGACGNKPRVLALGYTGLQAEMVESVFGNQVSFLFLIIAVCKYLFIQPPPED